MEALGLKLVALRPAMMPISWPGNTERSRPYCSIVASSSSSSSNSSQSSSSSSSSSERGRTESQKTRYSSTTSFLSRIQTYALLRKQMAVAAKYENYKEAARIRDSMKSFEEQEPVLRLHRLLKKSIEEERFEDAARYRNELNILAPHTLLKCSSDATTAGIRVQVRSLYIDSRSQPLKEQYFFAYRIRITNNSDRTVQLLRRHWIITDGNGETENIWGVGVVGEQPVIHPNTGFEYSSACPLGTPNGRMEGDFEMKDVGRVDTSTFNVAIAPFALSIMGDETDGFLVDTIL